jgi:hypothetical protein
VTLSTDYRAVGDALGAQLGLSSVSFRARRSA